MLNIRQQSKNGFCGIFVGIPQHQKGYRIYVPSTQKTFPSHDVVFAKTFSSVLSYTSHTYSEALDMKPEVLYISYDTSCHEQTFDIINFAHFEEGNLLENKPNTKEDK